VEKQDSAYTVEAAAKYLQPLALLLRAAQHLWLVGYGGNSVIQNSAIVEETLESSTIWWLVFTRIAPIKENVLKAWLRKHLPPDTLDVESLQTLNPWLQRRLGWDDVRTTPEFLQLLRQETRLPSFSFNDGLVADRHQLARAEMQIREPRVPVFSSDPVSCTRWGHFAYLAEQYGSKDMRGLLESTAAIIALPNIPIQALPTAPPLAVGNGAETAVQSSEEESDSEDGESIPSVCTVHVWGSEPFCVVNSRISYPETLQCILHELGEDVTFARFLVKLLYAMRQVTPPCPSLDPELLEQAKTLWALHVGLKPVTALQAHDLDLVDIALARPSVIRCRVCYKPCGDTDDTKKRLHSSCVQHTLECGKCKIKCNCSSRLLKLPEPPKVQPGEDDTKIEQLYKKRKTGVEALNLATTMWCRPKCHRCGEYAHECVHPKPECRPKSTKIAR